MGSLCCVASRPHGSSGTSREWPVGAHEPYWLINSSFSPPHQRWDYHLQSEGTQNGSNDSVQLFGSPSSNSKESRSWMRGGYHPTHQYPTSESGVVFFSSPSDTSLIEPWTPPPFQGINIDDYEAPSSKRDQTSGRLSFTPTMEGTSMAPTREASRNSSARFTGYYDTNLLTEASNNPKEVSKCELCDRLLSQRPMGSYDMPIAAILSCRHVFHAECLEKNTAISHRSDPPCPICSNVDTENSPEQVSFPSLRNVFPRRRQVFGESSSKTSWGCVRSGDCAEGALLAQKSSNRNRLKKSLFLKGNSSKDFSGKWKKSGTFPLHIFGGKFVDHEVNNGCSKAEA